MQGTIRIDIERLAKTYGIDTLAYADILLLGPGRRTLVLTPRVPASAVVDGVEIWFPEEVTG